MVITGDLSRVDLPKGTRSGLRQALEILDGVGGIAFVHFTDADVVRHPLVTRIVRAYERAEDLRLGAAERAAGWPPPASLTSMSSSTRRTGLPPFPASKGTVAAPPGPPSAGSGAADDRRGDFVLADDARIAGLNRAFRGIDAPTNVLSFPATEDVADIVGEEPAAMRGPPRHPRRHDPRL